MATATTPPYQIITVPNGTGTGTVNGTWIQVPIIWNYSTGITVGDSTIEEPEEKKRGECICKKCNEKNEFAEPNQSDGTFICYRCRKGY